MNTQTIKKLYDILEQNQHVAQPIQVLHTHLKKITVSELKNWLKKQSDITKHTTISQPDNTIIPLYTLTTAVPTNGMTDKGELFPVLYLTIEFGEKRLQCATALSISGLLTGISHITNQKISLSTIQYYDANIEKFISLKTIPRHAQSLTVKVVKNNTPENEKDMVVIDTPFTFTNSTAPKTHKLKSKTIDTYISQKPTSEMLIAQNAIGHGNLTKILLNQNVYNTNHTVFSKELDVSANTSDQESSGRCWIFAFTNMLRMHMIHRYKLPSSFEFSHVYLFFYDQLEKSNLFLNYIWKVQQDVLEDKSKLSLDNPVLRIMMKDPISDGGSWHMLENLVEKYGIIPKQCMNETVQSKRTSRMSDLINTRLREFAHELRFTKSDQVAKKRIHEMTTEIYNILTVFLGIPPATIRWEYIPEDDDKKDKKNNDESDDDENDDDDDDDDDDTDDDKKKKPRNLTKKKTSSSSSSSSNSSSQLTTQKKGITFKSYKQITDITPVDFFKTYVNKYIDLYNYVCVINYPHPQRPMHRWYTVKFLNNMVGSNDSLLLNITSEEMKSLVRESVDNGEPVWFAADVSKDCSLRHGILDPEILNYESIFKFKPHDMEKGYRMEYQDGCPDHAMLFKGYHKNNEHDTEASKWLVENSWGEESGKKGNLIMSDTWFDKHVYTTVIHRKHFKVLPQLDKCLSLQKDDKLIELEPWDTFGSLF